MLRKKKCKTLKLNIELSEPSGIVYVEGNLFVSDTNNNVVRKIDIKSLEHQELDLQVETKVKRTND